MTVETCFHYLFFTSDMVPGASRHFPARVDALTARVCGRLAWEMLIQNPFHFHDLCACLCRWSYMVQMRSARAHQGESEFGTIPFQPIPAGTRTNCGYLWWVVDVLCSLMQLWEGLLEGTIDFVTSDHSPCVSGLKCCESGDFFKAWGGISGLQVLE